jgi:hypothetical protein
MGFKQCKADPDIWMKRMKDHYEYVCVYVEDLMHFSKNPKKFYDLLTSKYGYKLKGVGPPKYHLGGDFNYDKEGTLAWGVYTYIKRMMQAFEKMFGGSPELKNVPLPEDDHPEIDDTELLDETGIAQYQSLIGALQWAVTLGRFDIYTAVTTMSSFRSCPRKGHLERLKYMYGYLRKFPHGAIRFRTGIPNHEANGMPKTYSWMDTVYGQGEEDIPHDMPIPLGKAIRMTSYCDANLMFDLVTGRSLSRILHMINQTPIAWFCKKQSTVETATYGSEFMVARQATEQIMDLRYLVRMMGIPIDGPTWLFGDNQSVITSSTIPSSKLNKRHNALSYHRVREAVAFKVLFFQYIKSEDNPSDLMSKLMGRTKFWQIVEPLLFWKGETEVPVPVPEDKT